MQYVGYKKIKIKNGIVYKENPKVTIDASAIAKGYGVDVVANYLESKGIKNYLVEIGGEIRLKGINPKHKKWSVAIDKPIDDSLSIREEFEEILHLNSGALATSGSYRKFYYKNGKKYSHTINPKTGYPVNHQLLSVSVYTKDCMSADAYATSFMVMGKDKTIAFLQRHKDLQVYLIYALNSNNTAVWKTENFYRFIEK
jgi:thiamine biosynthesis lipoprotein